MANLIGKDVLIVDEVDDTRTTLEYAVKELMKDVEEARRRSGRTGEEGRTRFSIFVLHVSVPSRVKTRGEVEATRVSRLTQDAQNKEKSKRGTLPDDMISQGRYLAAVTTPDVWICYPWEAT